MNKTSWIIVGGTGFICIVIAYFFLYPNVKQVFDIRKKTQIAKNELDVLNKKQEVLAALSKNNQLGGLYDIASKYIPESENSSDLVIELTSMANQANMKVDQISLDAATAPKAAATDTATTDAKTTSDAKATATDTTTDTTTTTPTDVKTNLSELKFSLKISGSFSDFLIFLKSTETSSRLLTFDNMSLSQSETNFSVQVSGFSYYKKGTSLENTLDNIKITEATINKFKNLKTYGVPINLPTESGFGRTNPFDTVP